MLSHTSDDTLQNTQDTAKPILHDQSRVFNKNQHNTSSKQTEQFISEELTIGCCIIKLVYLQTFVVECV